MIKVTLYDLKDITYSPENILEATITSDINYPTSSLEIVIPSSNIDFNLLDSFSLISFNYEHSNLFEGIINEKQIFKSYESTYIKIFAHSYASILIDSQANPQMYHSISLKDILINHAQPYGFTFKNIESNFLSASLPSFTIQPFTSEWSVIKSFVQESLNIDSIIIKNKSLYISDIYLDSKFLISNHHKSPDTYNKKIFNYSSICIKKLKENFFIFLDIPEIITSYIGQNILVFDDIIPHEYSKNPSFLITKLVHKINKNENVSHATLRTYVHK